MLDSSSSRMSFSIQYCMLSLSDNTSCLDLKTITAKGQYLGQGNELWQEVFCQGCEGSNGEEKFQGAV